jgi:hypothetical protein
MFLTGSRRRQDSEIGRFQTGRFVEGCEIGDGSRLPSGGQADSGKELVAGIPAPDENLPAESIIILGRDEWRERRGSNP